MKLNQRRKQILA